MRSLCSMLLLLASAAAVVGCPNGGKGDRELVYTEQREVCADRNPDRNLYWGDLHAHTGLSFDAWAYGNHHTPDDLYAFAQGQPMTIQPGDRSVSLSKPLDFAAVTDHHEYLGEIELCTTAGSPTYDSQTCTRYREGEVGNVVNFGMQLAIDAPERFDDVCDPDRVSCTDVAMEVWGRIQDAAEANYDRTSACAFTTFVGYEYTNALSVTNLHRNVIFRTAEVPVLPPSYFEQNTVWGLWREIDQSCIQADGACDAIIIPHNSNWSNGQLYYPDYEGARRTSEQAEKAAFRARIEPLAEMFQHKGDMECENHLAGLGGDPDPLCDFEKQHYPPFEDCGEEPGAGGVSLMGCVHRYEFVRNVLKLGLAEYQRLGVNPYRLGFIGSTDTHNATPGLVPEVGFEGHVGSTDDTPVKRLGPGNMTHHGVRYNGGGLAAVWAVENSRDALFEAFRRREVYATSGPRIEVRLFAGQDLPADWCDRDDRVALGYAKAVPMGGELFQPKAAPTLAVSADADPDSRNLWKIQIIKGWVEADGQVREQVFHMAGEDGDPPDVDLATCAEVAGGQPALCGTWTDPDFDPDRPTFYYARVVELPTCRWSVPQCNALPEAERPESCGDPNFYRAIQERAWTSAVWVLPDPPAAD